MYTYLLVNLFSILIPLIASFEKKRLHFIGKWKSFIPALVVPALIFILWDMLYTHLGVWGFEERYLTGIRLGNLPLEEWLFFFCIPYACLFTYDALKYLVRKDYFAPAVPVISPVLIILFLVVAIFNLEKIYTSVTFILTSVFILLHQYVFRSHYMGRFYFMFLIILAPFLLVNGILTGTFLEEQVVWYDDTQNLSIRVLTIPIEDAVYALLLLLANVSLFEFLEKKHSRPSAAESLRSRLLL